MYNSNNISYQKLLDNWNQFLIDISNYISKFTTCSYIMYNLAKMLSSIDIRSCIMLNNITVRLTTDRQKSTIDLTILFSGLDIEEKAL